MSRDDAVQGDTERMSLYGLGRRCRQSRLQIENPDPLNVRNQEREQELGPNRDLE